MVSVAVNNILTPTSFSSGHVQVSLYKILLYFKALLWESIVLLLPPPLAKPTLLQYYCTTIAQYAPRHRPSFSMPYTIQYWRWQYRVKANVQVRAWPVHGIVMTNIVWYTSRLTP